ncbi:hypothetical protein C6P46_000473 [Rhodotorula mucilaginosa]|uniref:Hepatocellular carcinoma-associated antigen 59-domain-containing protein n=1 Tax=Rhodotorula mucilaginosa TaxID=5537 RepID=A0A9P6VUG6_RHOMI|nr:hypothetical protein C6P46_000473 [Rhodotorula mucilaginosa]
MSDAHPISADSSATPAVPTFKRKKRPQAVRSSLLRGDTPGDASDSSAREQTPLSGFEGDAEDSTSETLEELLALRRLKRSTAGLELDRLNSGERKKRPKVVKTGEGGEEGVVVTSGGMLEGTGGGLRAGAGDRIRDDSEGPEAKARKIIKTDNFTGQTNTVDVDKHMLAYIEAELAKKRGPSDEASGDATTSKPFDPRDELYKVAEKYKFADIEEAEKGKKERDEEEGNVTLSASMLMGIPEVDLGIDTKLKNIEATEKAKRSLQDARSARAGQDDGDEFAANRFYRHRRVLESDSDALARARAEATAAADPNGSDADSRKSKHREGRRELATDEMALARFKKRQQQQWGK